MKVVVSSWAWVEKDKLSLAALQSLKAQLTITPRKVGNHPGDPPSPIPLWIEQGNLFGMAREYYLGLRKPEHNIEFRLTEGDKTNWIDIDFAATMRAEQSEALDVLLKAYKAGETGAMIQASPGWGKTVFGCGLMAALQVPTLVIVHKEFLMGQWEERINQFLPDAKVGKVQGDTCDFQGKHVVLAMVHSLAQRGHRYPLELQRWPGLLLVDECHRIGASTWAPVPAMFPTRYRLGLSATPRRKDGAENVFFYHLGPIRFRAKEQRMKPKIRRVWTNFRLAPTKFNPSLMSKQLLLRFLCANTARNKLITEQVVLAAKAGRKIMVLSERLEHLRVLEEMFAAAWPGPEPTPSTGQYVGGMDEDAQDESKKAQVLFATAQLVSEGFDLPALDTLFLTTPMSDVEQAVGRILRPYEGKKDPIVVDLRDEQVPYCVRAGKSRDALYERIT